MAKERKWENSPPETHFMAASISSLDQIPHSINAPQKPYLLVEQYYESCIQYMKFEEKTFKLANIDFFCIITKGDG